MKLKALALALPTALVVSILASHSAHAELALYECAGSSTVLYVATDFTGTLSDLEIETPAEAQIRTEKFHGKKSLESTMTGTVKNTAHGPSYEFTGELKGVKATLTISAPGSDFPSTLTRAGETIEMNCGL